MLCPVDDAKLQAASFDGHQIHRCPQCQGVAVTGKDFREARAHAAQHMQAPVQDATRARPCPADGTAMRQLSFKDVPMCACPKCYGLWLDAGQFSRLAAIAGPASLAAGAAIAQSTPVQENTASSDTFEAWETVIELGTDILGAIGDLSN